MPRKTFAVVFGKSDASFEKRIHPSFKRILSGRTSGFDFERFRREPGVFFSGRRVVIDIDEPRLPKEIKQLSLAAFVGKHPREVHRVNAERLAVVKQLAGMGYGVIVPYYERLHSNEFLDKIRPFARVFKASMREVGSVTSTTGHTTTEVDNSMLWARDLWKKVGSARVRRFTREGEEKFGDGGRSVPLSQTIHLADSSLQDSPEVRRLQAEGHKFFFTQRGEAFSQMFTRVSGRKVYLSHEHVDLFAGAVGQVLLVDDVFHRTNRSVIRQAVKESGLKLLFVPEDEADLHPTNFLSLGENKVLVDKAAKKTMALLAENGVEVVPSAVSIRANRASGGGLRCFVNEM